jgi:hypothetical protein
MQRLLLKHPKSPKPGSVEPENVYTTADFYVNAALTADSAGVVGIKLNVSLVPIRVLSDGTTDRAPSEQWIPVRCKDTENASPRHTQKQRATLQRIGRELERLAADILEDFEV